MTIHSIDNGDDLEICSVQYSCYGYVENILSEIEIEYTFNR